MSGPFMKKMSTTAISVAANLTANVARERQMQHHVRRDAEREEDHEILGAWRAGSSSTA